MRRAKTALVVLFAALLLAGCGFFDSESEASEAGDVAAGPGGGRGRSGRGPGGPGGFPGGFGPVVGSGDCVVQCLSGNPCPTDIPVNVDIKPGECPNPFHITGNPSATLTVAIVGKVDFDVTTIDADSVTIRRADGQGGSVSASSSAIGDVSSPGDGNCDCATDGADGLADLVLQFNRVEMQNVLGFTAGETDVELVIDGNDDAGTAINGSDCVDVS